MKMNIAASIKFQMRDLLKSSLGFFITIAAVTLFTPVLAELLGGEGNVSFGGYGAIAGIYLFVVGIVAPRSYLRLDAQMGVSRATSFVTQLISAVLISLVLSAAGTLLSALVRGVSSVEGLFMDLYQMMYRDGEAMGLSGYLMSACFDACICLCGYISGMFFTLMYWRLNKLWTVVVSLGLVVAVNLLFNASALLAPAAPWLNTLGKAFVDAITEGPSALMIFYLAASAVLACIEWLFLRRAYIRATAN